MTNRKDLVIAVLVTFCLTATLFLVSTSRSQTAAQQNTSPDVNHDGKIDMRDVVAVLRTFGTRAHARPSTENVTVVNPTLPVTIVNSSETILYATYDVSWGQNDLGSYNLISGGGELSVASYSSMSVFLQFEDVSAKDEEWNAMWTVFANWYLDTNGTFAAFDYLPFTVSTVTAAKGVQPIGVYSIKAPYVTLSPTLVNVYDCGFSNQFSPHASESATAICEIYVYLSRNEGTPSDQAMNDQQIGMIHDAATTTSMTFGPYLTEGYGEICIQMTSNVSCSVTVDDMLYPTVIYDSFSLSAGNVVQKIYEVQSQQIRIEFSIATPMPWEVHINIYLKP